MANKNNTKETKKKNVAPIKVEKIVDTPDNSKKEVFAIIIGILVVAALVVGSVIYFKGKENDPLVDDKHKQDQVIDIIDDPSEPVEEKKKEEKATVVKLSATTDKKKPSSNVKKECTTCDVVVFEEGNYKGKNNISLKTYVTDEEGSYTIEVKGTLKATKNTMIYSEAATMVNTFNQVSEKYDLTEEDIKGNQLLEELYDLSEYIKEEGLITVVSPDTKVVTHTFTIRIEEQEQIDWTKGVTVNGTTYNESVLTPIATPTSTSSSTGTFQDEDGINIIIGVCEDDLGPDATNTPISFDVAYTTILGTEVSNSYELNLSEVTIDYEEPTDEDEEGVQLEDDAVTEEDIEEYVDDITQKIENIEQACEELTSTEEEPALN